MRTIFSMLTRVKELKKNVKSLMSESVLDKKDDYTKLQKEQLKEGIRSDDAYIFNVKTKSDEYSPMYAKYKGKSFPIDLYDKGDFYSGIQIEESGKNFNVFSNDEKSESLQKRYGKQILGLGSEKKTEFINDVDPVFMNRVVTTLNV